MAPQEKTAKRTGIAIARRRSSRLSRVTITGVHDANAVLGRANRFLARHVRAIATSLPGVHGNDNLGIALKNAGLRTAPKMEKGYRN